MQKLQKDDLIWGGKQYIIYYEDTISKNLLLNITKQIKDPEIIKHIAIVPDNNRIYMYLIPKYNKVFEPLNILYFWAYSAIIN